ncbi:MAG: dUTP diphosphatase, partial [Firmicutes bacterium]|nr:dUTP diphosphatase [Bacillota bacterium]
MLIKVSSKNGNLPVYQTEGSAGADLKACLDEPITLMPGERRLIPTGMRIELPEGVEAQIRARSGLSIKHGITMINGVGTVDSDYRGEWNVPMVNLGSEPYTIHDGDR